MRKNDSGFTIVELLIVIVVIAILAAITIVAYNGIRQQAENSATVSELSQLQRQIQVEILQSTGTSVSIKTPLAFFEGLGTEPLSTPVQSAQQLTLYGVFDTHNNPAASNWSNIILLGPSDTYNAFRLRTGSSADASARAFYATSSQTNRDLTRHDILNTNARHVGWVTADGSSIYAGFDTTADLSASLSSHTGWNFDAVHLYSNGSYTAVAALVFDEYHDSATRNQIVQWLSNEYNVGL